MSKVYVVIYDTEFEGTIVDAVFSTEQLAQAYLQNKAISSPNLQVRLDYVEPPFLVCVEVDATDPGPLREYSPYSVHLWTDDEGINVASDWLPTWAISGRTSRLLASGSIDISRISGVEGVKMSCQYAGFHATGEEAIEEALKRLHDEVPESRTWEVTRIG